MFPLLGGLISGGLNLLGGMFGQQNQANINSQNVAAQEAINQQNLATQEDINKRNVAMQEAINANNWSGQSNINLENIQMAHDFAQHGIQWRVADAKAAGINPLAALGASTASAPTIVGATDQAPTQSAPQLSAPRVEASNAFGTGLANFGQDISRAIAATRSPEEQAVAIEKTRQDLESGQLDNELKRAQLASSVSRLASAQVGPGIPKGKGKDYSVLTDAAGNKVIGPSREDEGWSWLSETAKAQWMNREVPRYFGYGMPSELGKPVAGFHWYENPFTGRAYQMRSWWDVLNSGNHSGVTPRQW